LSTGLFEDLYPFIDADPELSRGSFVEGILEASESGGGLYKLFPYFNISTLIGNPYFVGDYPGWGMDEFQAVIRANPQADTPLGSWVTGDTFLENAFVFYINDFIDRENATADFDNDVFVQLLESISDLPLMSPNTDQDLRPENELVAAGRQIISMFHFLNIEQYQAFQKLYGGEIIFKGYPSEDGSGRHIMEVYSGVSMTVTCSDKEAAWEFIRSFLTDDWQRKNRAGYFLPVSNAVFEEHLEKASIERDIEWVWVEGIEEIAPITQGEADRIREVVASVIGIDGLDRDLRNIVAEEASKFFHGQISAREAARIIQSRASIYMSEQHGW
jgi:ABC-type glycerol-3-phosphate transport system substrate-binding protein